MTVNEYVLQHCDSGVAYVTVISGVLCHSDRWLSCHLFVYMSQNYLIREVLIVLTSRDVSLFAHMWVVCYRQTLNEVGAAGSGMRKGQFSRYWLLTVSNLARLLYT